MKYNLYKAMVGGRITAFGRACDLISVCIELPDHTTAYLHTQTLMRVIQKSKVILSSYDMCKCGILPAGVVFRDEGIPDGQPFSGLQVSARGNFNYFFGGHYGREIPFF